MATKKQPKPESEQKPTAFKQGVPKSRFNGFYGVEKNLMADPTRLRTAIVTYAVDEIVNKELAGERYPVLAVKHIEPIEESDGLDVVQEIQRRTAESRTGETELDFNFESDESEGPEE